MTVLEIIGYASAMLIGLALGLSGAGGSILTVPIMVYLLGIEPMISTAYSLFVVGSTAMVGAVRNLRQGFTRVPIAIAFGIPSMISIFITRKYIITHIPEQIMDFGGLELTKSIAILLLFALLMIFSAVRMIKSGKRKEILLKSDEKPNYLRLALQGLFVGFLTGLVGAGGGFLIVPALVILAKLPMKNAIGTSLLIISVNSLTGFSGDLMEREVDWSFLIPFTLIAVSGIFIGMRLASKVDGPQLKRGFGYFVLIIALFIISRELFQL
jgi:uncharacterized membrane protein YfcA